MTECLRQQAESSVCCLECLALSVSLVIYFLLLVIEEEELSFVIRLMILALILLLGGCKNVDVGTYEQEICRSWHTEWNQFCPRDFFVVKEEIPLPDDQQEDK